MASSGDPARGLGSTGVPTGHGVDDRPLRGPTVFAGRRIDPSSGRRAHRARRCVCHWGGRRRLGGGKGQGHGSKLETCFPSGRPVGGLGRLPRRSGPIGRPRAMLSLKRGMEATPNNGDERLAPRIRAEGAGCSSPVFARHQGGGDDGVEWESCGAPGGAYDEAAGVALRAQLGIDAEDAEAGGGSGFSGSCGRR